MEIKLGDQGGINQYQPYIKQILDTLALVLGKPGIASAFVSNESWVWDFLDTDKPQEPQLERISKALNIKIENANTTILDLAKKLASN